MVLSCCYVTMVLSCNYVTMVLLCNYLAMVLSFCYVIMLLYYFTLTSHSHSVKEQNKGCFIWIILSTFLFFEKLGPSTKSKGEALGQSLSINLVYTPHTHTPPTHPTQTFMTLPRHLGVSTNFLNVFVINHSDSNC